MTHRGFQTETYRSSQPDHRMSLSSKTNHRLFHRTTQTSHPANTEWLVFSFVGEEPFVSAIGPSSTPIYQPCIAHGWYNSVMQNTVSCFHPNYHIPCVRKTRTVCISEKSSTSGVDIRMHAPRTSKSIEARHSQIFLSASYPLCLPLPSLRKCRICGLLYLFLDFASSQ